MNLRDGICLMISAVCLSAAPGRVSADEPLVTRSPSFSIPFSVDGADGSPLSGYAVLFASKDGGPMEQFKRVPISAGRFEFTAPSDGLWSFAIRMTDRSGVPVPDDGPLTPELQVLVDTRAPVLNLDLIDAGQGTVQVQWNCPEQFEPGSLRLEYADGIDGRWRPIETRQDTAGQAVISSRPGSSVVVRGQLADAAGNVGHVRREIVLGSSTVRTTAAPAEPVGDPSMRVPTVAAPVGQTPFVPAGTPSFAPAGTRGSTPLNGTAFPAASPPQPAAPADRVHIPAGTPPAAPSVSGAVPGGPFPAGTAAPGISWSGTSAPAAPTAHSVPAPTPGPAAAQLVPSSAFQLDYTIEDVGPSGISSVELFITEDGGAQWFRYGNDTDVRSPMPVDVQGEGTFGFAIRVRNGVGFVDPPPQPGDPPEIVVTVDQTAPAVQLAEPQILARGSALVRLQWTVQDVHATMVRLEWSSAAAGPWNPVFDWQTDPGGFDWPVQPGSPHSIHFRLLARDAAGNIGTAQTIQPVLIDLKRPRARVIGVQRVSRSIGY